MQRVQQDHGIHPAGNRHEDALPRRNQPVTRQADGQPLEKIAHDGSLADMPHRAKPGGEAWLHRDVSRPGTGLNDEHQFPPAFSPITNSGEGGNPARKRFVFSLTNIGS